MCVIDFDDGERWTIFRQEQATARKPYQCNSCRRPIRKGERYLRHFSVIHGKSESEKMCCDCAYDMETFGAAHGVGGWMPSDFRHVLNECIAEGDEESEANWMPMYDRLQA